MNKKFLLSGFRLLPAAIIPLVILYLAQAAGWATDYTWTGSNTSNWNNGDRWATSLVDDSTYPDDADDNIVGNTGTAVAQVNGNYTVGDITPTSSGWTIQGSNGASTSSLTFDVLTANVGISFRGNNSAGVGKFLVTGRLVTVTGGNVSFGISTSALNELGSLNLTEGLTFNNAATQTVSINVAGNYNLGLISASGSGAKNVYLGQVAVDASAVTRIATVSGISNSSGGRLTIGVGTTVTTSAHPVTLRLNNTSSYSTAAVLIDGTGNAANTLSLLKEGSGTQTLTGSSTYSGGTTVNAGTLLVNNTAGSGLGSGAVAVDGGILGGSGSFTGNVTVNNGGTLSPGASIESLGVGSITFNAGSNFAFELNTSAETADLLYGGDGSTLTLSGSPTLSLVDLGSGVALDEGTKFTLIAYDGVWNGGTFLGRADDSIFSFANNLWRINYNDTSAGSNFASDVGADTAFVTMTVIPEPGTWALLGLSLTALLTFRKRFPRIGAS